ncbi:hypothetical protein [Motiliproteus sp. MSK22-1]|uniref:hypothetical protein n=1 Tax=Motiliproteus sp. MSK22-1 TaxID=1897630 RepID=UPI000976FDDA|nr:hypothetical protein [Motiliproteus sp. MSK22-1]OMH31766.1 hypothetical protein BGP75_16760 [Motiliproteus sp. MSK22-1]
MKVRGFRTALSRLLTIWLTAMFFLAAQAHGLAMDTTMDKSVPVVQNTIIDDGIAPYAPPFFTLLQTDCTAADSGCSVCCNTLFSLIVQPNQVFIPQQPAYGVQLLAVAETLLSRPYHPPKKTH